MFDGLLGRGFAAKCKSLIKQTKNRIDVIRRRRKATEKFLKRDIADLLANRLEDNAYNRAEGLIAELTLSSCYDFIEQSCDFVLKHLSVLQKLSGCPEECREAISTLMFAAARFSDLPELRDLRQMFQERYGDLECYVNQEFAANLNSKIFTLEMKVRLMQDIASEFSIKWDSKAFELRMSKSVAFAQGKNTVKHNHPTDNKPLHENDAASKGVKHDIFLQRSPGYPNDEHRLHYGKEAVVSKRDENHLRYKSKQPENGFNQPNSCDEVSQKRDGRSDPSPQRVDVTSKKSDRGYWKEGSMLKPTGSSSQDNIVEQFQGGSNLHNSWGNAIPLRESKDTATSRKSPGRAGFPSSNNANEPFAHGGVHERQAQRDETPRVKSYYNNAIPPPYVKHNSKRTIRENNLVSSGIPAYPSAPENPNAGSSSERTQLGSDNSEQDQQANGHSRPNKQIHENELSVREDAAEAPALKHKSVRRKHSKSRSNNDDGSNEDAEVGRKSRSRRRDESKRGLQILFDDERHKTDEDERIIDRLLIHYSKKPSIPLPEKSRRKSKTRHGHQIDNSSVKNGTLGGPDETPGIATHPPRSASLPHEESGAMEVNKVKLFNRAATFQADGSKEARHVHPKLPDYDDLAARMAALRGS
ncbi:hypothetical protein HN51_070960 [Arachis hypogaea]|uniref:IST1-like protein n=1 Tax=Arachis hypogaea TaxID=3818 RepID=A0A444Z030_ARAHY|nr:uncharacterized protein LOC107644366 [Arachis ipaensis]XP_025656037.1 uncharacterized protein LOC112751192 [Arachis hypogaea]QHO13460.1 IST1-like protein [Arachis hypogaea]RYR07508.1 hypothetical protein Ahy_B05g074871 [Arachis hypogaea]